MRFLILILLGYGTGLLVMRDQINASTTMPGGVIWLDLLIAILLATAFGIILARRSASGPAVSNMTAAVSTLLMGVTILGVMQVANFSRATPIAALATINAAETQIDRAWDGHYRAIAQIEGTDVGLMVDTGASIVLLRYDDAMRIGIDPAGLEYSIPLTTAGGRSYVAPYMFETIKIGAVVVHNVEGAIAPRGALHSSLLGMSYLEQLTETVIRSDEMILRQ
ncbi:MAG: TIGR02281 family clan AA aspartic protease [Rhodobacteraceae bacterium]|nr:TIGR02281 family clan AA aspartic protease [Paracoccaceae bacterium]